eukprot:TRINITY_DN925_c0_g1_i1.p1 TRINITY_DN925_c0_g1~~TRINITY_DN925_c0_g1_i1.p1  ORF type:complete len:224 (+),score=39.34 TRINITY_DN925_c0_g1_i1:633-1304(+)
MRKKTIEKPWEKNHSEIDTRVNEMMKQGIIRTHANLDNVEFKIVKSWGGNSKEIKVGEYDCHVFEMTGFETVILKREIKANHSRLPISARTKFDHSVGDKLDSFDFDAYINAEPAGERGTPLLYSAEALHSKNRSFKGTVYMTPTFPRKVQDLLPIFEVLSPTHKHFKKLSDFVSLKLPEKGFPIKLEIPAFPTVTGTATFLAYQEKDISPDLFVVPSDYKIA